MTRRNIILAAFLLALMGLSQMGGCGRDKDIEEGKRLLRWRKYDEALAAFTDAAHRKPENDVAHYYLTQTYLRLRKDKEALFEYKQLLTLNSPKADDEELVVWIYGVLGLDRCETIRLTFNEAGDYDPSFSPDGEQIVFRSMRDKNFEIYVMASDGSDQRRLTDNRADDRFPAFSPDGEQIVFLSARDMDVEIYVMKSDGSRQRRLTANKAGDYEPSFSPDGKEILFVSWRDVRAEIYAMASDGSDQRPLTINEVDDDTPSFSPDGKKIVFVSKRDGNREIYVMDLTRPVGRTQIAEALGGALGE